MTQPIAFLWTRFETAVVSFREETGLTNAQISDRAGLGPNWLSQAISRRSATTACADKVLAFIAEERARRRDLSDRSDAA